MPSMYFFFNFFLFYLFIYLFLFSISSQFKQIIFFESVHSSIWQDLMIGFEVQLLGGHYLLSA